jgi:hypothetical protein
VVVVEARLEVVGEADADSGRHTVMSKRAACEERIVPASPDESLLGRTRRGKQSRPVPNDPREHFTERPNLDVVCAIGWTDNPERRDEGSVQDKTRDCIEKRFRVLRQRVEEFAKLFWIRLDAVASIVAALVWRHRDPPSA